jgi:hypothetical protein
VIHTSSPCPPRLRTFLALAGLPLASVVLAGCSLLYDLNATQCQVDADCAHISDGLICGSNHVCKLDDTGCGTNSECLDQNGPLNACIKDSGKDRGQCLSLTTPDCSKVLPLDSKMEDDALRNGDPIIFGSFSSVQLDAFLANHDLAVTEFEQTALGLPTKAGTRPLLMVVCNGDASADNSGNFTGSLDASMDHLISLHVPGVASDLAADDLKHVFETKGNDANMFFMSSQETNSTLDALQDNGLVWEMLPDGRSLGQVYAPVVNRTIAYLQNTSAMSGTVRIAQVNTPDIPLLADIQSTVVSAPPTGIFFNNMSAVQNLQANNYLGLTTPSYDSDKTADLSSQIQALLNFKPHIIISTGSLEFVNTIIPALERAWDTSSQARPFYILSPYQYTRNGWLSSVNANLHVQQRLVGINAPSAIDPTAYNKYLINFDAKNPTFANTASRENYYDATYYLLYAAVAAAPTLTDGLSMVQGMARLLNGKNAYNVGPDDIPDAVADLINGHGTNITLNGTDGPPNFDINTGGRNDFGDVWCIDNTGATKSDVLRYDASSQSMTGTSPFPCFSGY